MPEKAIIFNRHSDYVFAYNYDNPSGEPNTVVISKPAEVAGNNLLFLFKDGYKKSLSEHIQKRSIIAVRDDRKGEIQIMGWLGKYRILNEDLCEKYFISGALKLRLAEEHERRFLIDLKNLPGAVGNYPMTKIIQGYPGGGTNWRIRQSFLNDLVYTKTIKTGSGVSRPEFERKISKDKFDMLWKQVEYYLKKDRYHITWKRIKVELNIYQEELSGYSQLEVEFKSNKDALAFKPPTWFGKEVTDDPCHGNFSLAKYGLPK